MGFLSGIGSAIGGIASTILGNNSAKQEAQNNRDWQTDMSNTSVQRRVEDLKSAGLNPLLAVSSASSGASTPSGAQANIQRLDMAGIASVMNSLSNARLVSAQATAQEQENGIFATRVRKLELENELTRQNILNQYTVRELNKAKTLDAKASVLLKQAEAENVHMTYEQAKRNVQLLDLQLSGIAGTGLGQDLKYFSDVGSNPSKALSALFGLATAGPARAIQGLINMFKKGDN